MSNKNIIILVVVVAGIALVVAGMLYTGSPASREAQVPMDLAQEANNVDTFGDDLAALKEGDALLEEVHGSLTETADGTAAALDMSSIASEAASADFSQDLSDLKQSDSELAEISGGLNTVAQ